MIKILCSSLLATTILLNSGVATASACILGRPDVSSEMKESKYVIVGHLQSTRRNQHRFFSYDGKRQSVIEDLVVVGVDKRIKGTPARTIKFYNSVNTTAEFPILPDRQYLIFLRMRESGDLYVDTCGNTKEVIRLDGRIRRELRL
jgi:hypothetical protein